MKTRMSSLFMVAFVGVCAAWPWLVESQEDMFAEGHKEFEAMVDAVNDFVGAVRFNEADVESVIELWDEYDEFGQAIEYDDEEMVDFDDVVADPEYRRWAASHGLDAKGWLQKTVRITMTLYREQLLQSAEQMPHQVQQQMAMIDQQRDQLGEETYQQMKEAMEASAAFGKQMAAKASELPEATASEMAALADHRDQLMMLMIRDEDDGYGYEEDFEDNADWE